MANVCAIAAQISLAGQRAVHRPVGAASRHHLCNRSGPAGAAGDAGRRRAADGAPHYPSSGPLPKPRTRSIGLPEEVGLFRKNWKVGKTKDGKRKGYEAGIYRVRQPFEPLWRRAAFKGTGAGQICACAKDWDKPVPQRSQGHASLPGRREVAEAVVIVVLV